MKILAITSRYPPYHFGGYEIRCKNILDGLCQRGYEVLVITSKKEAVFPSLLKENRYKIIRGLQLRARPKSLIDMITRWHRSHYLGMLMTFAREVFFDLVDMRIIDGQIKQFEPDVIYLGHITNLSKSLMPYLAGKEIPIVYDEGGSGLIDSWREKGIWYKFVDDHVSSHIMLNKIRKLFIKIIGKVSSDSIKSRWDWPADMQIIFNGELNRNNAIIRGIPINGAKVVHSGIDVEKFTFGARQRINLPLVCIVPSRIEPRKGQLDAVRLLAALREIGIDGILTLVGKKWEASYYSEILREIKQLCLEDKVRILPMLAHDELVKFYHQADICFFPSYYATGFSRVPLEAMACGCIVISYGKEGSDEIIQNEHTGFLVRPADFAEITDVIKDLISNPDKVKQILENSRKNVSTKYSMKEYIGKIEEVIKATVHVH